MVWLLCRDPAHAIVCRRQARGRRCRLRAKQQRGTVHRQTVRAAYALPMSKSARPPRLEKRCPLPTTHTRLHQLHEHWHRTAADYGHPDDFVTSLNAALVSLRSIPELLDKEQRHVPAFEAWYAPHDAAFRADPLLRWLVKARNHVVHHGDLELHSRARVRVLIDGRELPEIEVDVPPLLGQDEIASLIAPRLSAPVRERGGPRRRASLDRGGPAEPRAP